MKKKFLMIMGIIIIGGIIAFLLFPKEKEKTLPSTITVKRERLDVSVAVRGKIEAEKYKIGSKISGIIDKVKVKEGDIIKQGEVLLTFDRLEYLSKLKGAEKDIFLYKNRIFELENSPEIKEAEKNYFEAKMAKEKQEGDYNACQNLYQMGGISKKELEDSYSKYLIAEKNYQLQETSLSYKKKNNIEQIKLVNSQLQEANAFYEWVKKQMGFANVSSPIDGMVIKKSEDIGEGFPVSIGAYLFTLIPLKYKIKALIDEGDISKVNIENNATIRMDAYPNLTLNGKVTEIAPSAILSKGNVMSFEITLDIIDKSGFLLKPEMQCDVNILKYIPNALKLPHEAIIETEGKRYVFVLEGKKMVRREIKTGLELPMEVEVLSGIKEGDKVIINPPESL